MANPSAYFISRLIDLKNKDDRGALATIRRSFTRSETDFNVLAVIGKYMPGDLSIREIRTHMLVAGLFSINPVHSDKEYFDFGATLSSLRAELQNSNSGADGLERKFSSLLNSEIDDLPFKLRQLMRFIAGKNIPVNYHILLSDLLRWGASDKYVQLGWARSFWSGRSDHAENGGMKSDDESTELNPENN